MDSWPIFLLLSFLETGLLIVGVGVEKPLPARVSYKTIATL